MFLERAWALFGRTERCLFQKNVCCESSLYGRSKWKAVEAWSSSARLERDPAPRKMAVGHPDVFPCYYPRLRVFRGLPPLRPLRRDAIRLALLVDRPPRFPISDRKFRTARLIVIKLTFWPANGRLKKHRMAAFREVFATRRFALNSKKTFS